MITPSLTALAGVFDGNPLGNNPNNISGTNFNLHNGALYIGELQYAINQPSDGQMVGVPQSGLPGTYKIGVWYNNERFDDLSTDNTGLSLANPQSTGTAQSHHGNYSFYAVADQMIWRPDPDEPRSIGVFARVMGAPGDRNLVSVSANAGIVMKAPFAGRDNDSVGIGLAVGFRGGIWNIGAEGQFTIGALAGGSVALAFYPVTGWWLLPLMSLAGIAGGAALRADCAVVSACGAHAVAYFRARRRLAGIDPVKPGFDCGNSRGYGDA